MLTLMCFVCLRLKVMRCSKIASVKVSEITELLIKALENDKKARWAEASRDRASVSWKWTFRAPFRRFASGGYTPAPYLSFAPSRKEGGRCGFAESMPQERITALKFEETSVEMTDVAERASDVVQGAEAPPLMYPELGLNKSRICHNVYLFYPGR